MDIEPLKTLWMIHPVLDADPTDDKALAAEGAAFGRPPIECFAGLDI
jgi:hypothetical protein